LKKKPTLSFVDLEAGAASIDRIAQNNDEQRDSAFPATEKV